MSARDIVRLANQSVDEFLIDLESKHDIDNEIDNDNDSSFNRTSLPSLRNFSVNGGAGLNSPTTEPLHVDQSILDGIDTLSFDDDDDAINQDEDDEESRQEQKQEYFLKNSHITLNGPKPVPVESPLKSSLKSPKRSPKKAVTIDDSPSKIHNYEAESEPVSSDLDSDISTSSLEVPSLNWTGISVKPFESNPLSSRLAKLPSKPLPELKPSQSDYSIQSMPNLSFVPSSPSLDSDDSDATLAASPVVNTATRMSPLEMKRPNMTKTFSSGDLSSKVNQFHYDHDHYLQDMQSGSLIEPENIKNNIVESEQLRHELKAEPMMQQNEELKNQNKLIEDFKLENDGVNRSDSLKSNISISADECLLKTRIVQTPIHATDPSCEPEITMHVDTNTDDEAEEGEEEKEKEVHPVPVRAHAHKRSSSLSDFVGGIIRSFSSKTISKNEESTQIEPIRRSFSARNVSAQSVATTITDSGFVSAAEDLYNSDNSVSHINYSKHEDANKTLDTIVVDASTDADDDANEYQDDAEASSNYETSSVKDASFTSQDLVLQVPFEDDVFDHEYDAFNQSVQTSRNTSNSSNGARIISIERGERDEVLQIWSQQKNYKIPPRKLAEFDSIHTPIKASYVVNNTHPKAIKVLNAIHDERKISEEIASSWIYNKLEVLPGGVNRKLAHRKSLSAAGIIENVYAHDHNHIYNDAADDIQYELLSNVSGDSVVHDTTAELTGTSFNATAAELAPASAQVKAPTLVEDSTMELTVGINDDDTSLMRDIKSWDPDYSASGNSALDNSTHTIWHDALRNHHKPNQDSIDILKQVWNENKSVGGGGDDDVGDHRDHNGVVRLTHSDTFERLQAGWSPRKINIESYINKRNVSDGSDIQYNVKEGMGGKAQVYQDVGNPVLPPQSASIYMYGNESFSKIVPDLGIADGLDEDGGDIYSINTGVKVSAFDATSMLEWVPASRSSQHVEPAYEAPKSPVSPARQKMIEKFEELQRQKQDMESHRRMQQKLHSKIHAEAEVMKAFYPQEEQKKHAIDEGVLLKSQQLSGDDSVGLYEEFSDSPTKIQRQVVVPMELTHPHPHASMNPDFVSGNPFESPKIRSMMKESSTFKNVGIAHNSADVESVNPFEDSTSMNFQKIASDTPTAKNSVKITDSMKKKKLVMGEQGRLFLKVENVNGLKLPDMKRYNAKFQLTLDNGIHCIKTDFADIGDGNTIKINKEFELIVAEKLDIVLTLKLKYDKPLPQKIQVSEKKTVKSKGLKGKLFGKKDVQIVKKMVTKPAEEDLLSSYIASDGSFSKLKISFDDYKQQIFGKPSTYSLTCYNEWKSTKASSGVVKNYKPIAICALNMKMMFLPRISEKEIFPLSINNALSQLREMRNFAEVQHEGFLWQEGGDVQVSTRRMYKLNNYDMQAFNISNNKLKAKINMKKVIDVVSPQTGSAQGKRVISDYDGMLLNHGFRIVFANKEHIDFGCDTAAERDAWVEKIQELITVKNVKRQPWLTTMAKAMKDVPVTSMV